MLYLNKHVSFGIFNHEYIIYKLDLTLQNTDAITHGKRMNLSHPFSYNRSSNIDSQVWNLLFNLTLYFKGIKSVLDQ